MTTKAKGPWTDRENAAIVGLYFEMLDKAVNGQPYNKAAMIRTVSQPCQNDGYYGVTRPLAERSKGSIEAKLMNCSAAHRDISAESGGKAETMDGHGYRALANYQASLRDAMAAHLKWRELQGQTA